MGFTPCCCAVTALRWHVVAITTDSATSHPWRRGFPTCRSLPEGFTRCYWVLLRSDGFAVACGDSGDEQCRIPSLSSWLEWLQGAPPRLRYTCEPPAPTDRILQAHLAAEDQNMVMTCFGLDGLEVLSLRTHGSELASDLLGRLAANNYTWKPFECWMTIGLDCFMLFCTATISNQMLNNFWWSFEERCATTLVRVAAL